MKLLTKEHQESHENAKICSVHSVCNLKYSVPKKISVDFYNESNYDYHFIIKESAEEFEEQLTCLGENTNKYISFTVQIKKEITSISYNKS